VKTPLALSLLCAASLALAAAPAPVLTGVILDGGDSVAFISSEPGRDRTYRVGDALPGGAVLASIEVTRVTLLAGGHRETLPLKGLDTHSVPTGASAGKLPVRAIPAHAVQRSTPLDDERRLRHLLRRAGFGAGKSPRTHWAYLGSLVSCQPSAFSTS